VTQGTALAENVRLFGNGTVVPQEDAPGLAAAMLRALQRGDFPEREEARRRVFAVMGRRWWPVSMRISIAKFCTGLRACPALSSSVALRAKGPATSQPRATPWVGGKNLLSPEGAGHPMFRPLRTGS